MQYLGEISAFATAICWAFCSTSFEIAGKKIGSMNLNLSRLFIGMFFISSYTCITRGVFFPIDATPTQWFWLSLSGIIGMVVGDVLLFEAFVQIGSRISMLIYSSVPPMSAILAYLILGESMTYQQIIGMMITLLGIAIVITASGGDKKLKLSYGKKGVFFAFGGALGQALGYVIGKVGMGSYDAFASSQIRILAAIFGFAVFFTLRGQWPSYRQSLKRSDALISLTIGSFFGPFLGVSLSLYAIQRINPGVASTLIALTPVILIPYAYFVKNEKLTFREVVGTCTALVGIGVMFL